MELSDQIQTAVLIVAFLSLILSVFISWKSLRMATETLAKMDREFNVQRVDNSMAAAATLLEVVGDYKGQVHPFWAPDHLDSTFLMQAQTNVHSCLERARAQILLMDLDAPASSGPSTSGPAYANGVLLRDAVFLYGAMMGVYLTLVNSDTRVNYEKTIDQPVEMRKNVLEQMLLWFPFGTALSEADKASKRDRYKADPSVAQLPPANWAMSVLDDATEVFVGSLKGSNASRLEQLSARL